MILVHPWYLSPDMFSESEGTGVSSSQATPPPLDVSPSVSTHALLVTSCSPASSPVPPSPPLSDFPSWVLSGWVSRFYYSTSFVVLLVSLLGS